MRYVAIEHVKANMILGKTLFGEMGEVLLREGSVIKENYITKIDRLGYSGLYIKDAYSEDIDVKGLISEELQIKTVKAVKTMMSINRENKKDIEKSFEEIENLVETIVSDISMNKNLMINMIDLKVANDYTFYHSVNVSVISLVIALALKMPTKDLYNIGMAGLMHDIGKINTPNEILDKPGVLTIEEFEIIKKHPLDGYNYVKEKLSAHTKTYLGILQHHERFDGKGYPYGLKGKDISLFARIITVADIYDALTSDRTYRKKINPSEAMEYIMGGGGTMFDIEIVKEFAKVVAPYPVGTCVKLTNGVEGIVVENFADCCLRPKIKVIYENDKVVTPYYLNLNTSNLNVTIKESIDVLTVEI